jgi:uncharacterized protein (UPF0333 family)
MAGQNIDAVFAAIIKDCQAVAAEAVKNAAKKTQNDIVKEAQSYLRKYYNNYKPKRYKRTYQLKNSIIPIFEDKSQKGKISIEVGVKYDSSKLSGLYKSNSWYHQTGATWIERKSGDFDFDSQNNGIPQPEWILNNFLEGIHPWGQDDTESTQSLMVDFFDRKLPDHIEEFVKNELFNVIISKL